MVLISSSFLFASGIFAVLIAWRGGRNLVDSSSSSLTDGSAGPIELWRCSPSLSVGDNQCLYLRASRNKNPFFETPEFSCLPQRIHVAQRSNVFVQEDYLDDEITATVSMTISFLLDYQKCSPRQAKPLIIYGRINSSNSEAEERTIEGISRTKGGDLHHPLQFNYTSHQSNGLFQSDWIYHMELPQLQAGRQEYWYQIIVVPSIVDARIAQSSAASAGSDHQKLPFTLAIQQFSMNCSVTCQQNAPFAYLFSKRHEDVASKYCFLGKSPFYTFMTPPLPGHATTLALLGDLGQTVNSTATAHNIFRAAARTNAESALPEGRNLQDQKNLTQHSPVTQVLIAGDMAYADSNPRRWMSWFDLMEPLFRTTPLHVAAGNHEIECDTENHRLFLAYENYFHNPNRIRDADIVPPPILTENERKGHHSCSAPSEYQAHYNYGNSFYSFQHGNANIIVLSSYSNTSQGSTQYTWLQHELSKVNRSVTPWLLVAFHCPFYTTFRGHENEKQAMAMKEAMEPLFVQYGVNFVVAGHDHGYMRTYPLYQGSVDETGQAPIYLTLGAGGNREHHSSGYRHTQPEIWVAKRTLVDYGFGLLSLPNASHALLTWVRDYVEDGPDGIQESVWLVNKQYGRDPTKPAVKTG